MPANHYSAKLSELDMTIVRHIPPGGNWKNVPTSVPTARDSKQFARRLRGPGRTYYGRLA